MQKSIVRVAIVVGLILLIPLVLTLLGSGVDGEGWHWTLGDFIVIGTLLLGTGLAIDFAAKKITNPVYRVFAVVAIVALFLLIWAGMVANVFERLFERLLESLLGLS